MLRRNNNISKPSRNPALGLRLFVLGAALLLVMPAPSPVRIALLGDIMLGRDIAAAHADGSWQEALTAIVPLTHGVDLTLANLESPLGIQDQAGNNPGYNLCAPPDSVSALASSGLDLLSVENNHANDCPAGGDRQTGKFLQAAGIQPIYSNEPVYRTLHGVRLAFFAFDDISLGLDGKAAAQSVRQAHTAGWLPVVSMHWGSEYHPGPDQRQRDLAQILADAGAALVWGHHPHVVQPVEWLQGEGRANPTLVAFSLGNALFDQPAPPDARRSALLEVTFSNAGVERFQVSTLQMDLRRGRVIPADTENSALVMHRLGLDD